MEVDAVEAESVFIDDAVDPAVAAATDGAAGVLAGAAVAHLEEEFDDEAFEEIGRGDLDAGEEIGCEGASELGVGRLDLLFGIFSLLGWDRRRRRGNIFVFGGPEFYEFRKSVEVADVDPGRCSRERSLAIWGDSKVCSFG